MLKTSPLLSSTSALAFCALAALPALAQPAPAPGQVGPGVPDFTVRSGYRVTLVAKNFGEARFLELDDKGTLYVSQPGKGTITALTSAADGTYANPTVFIKDKSRVHGMQWYDGWLWFTTSGAIYKARDTNGDHVADETVTVIPDGQLPEGGGHWWRSICVTPTGFFTSIGDDGNISDHTGDDREKIWHYDLDGSNKTLWSSGIRNTEKLRLQPGTTELWGCDHGSDNIGKNYGEGDGKQPITDMLPPCEFNHYIKDGFYGHPFIVGNRIPRPEFSTRPDIIDLATKTIPPAWPFGAHWAPNGWTFLTKDTVGASGDAVAALHGSWNSSKKVGYRVERIMFDRTTMQPMGAVPLVSTLGPDGNQVLGRPVDCLEAPDGSLLWSDDGHESRLSHHQT